MKLILIVSFMILVPAIALAQITTGNIEGTVTGPEGETLAGVQIEVSGPAMQGTLTSVSQDNGYFLIPDLRVGKYDLHVIHDLYAEVIVSSVTVQLGFTTNTGIIELAMQAYQLETLVVTAQAPLIDSASAVGGGNLTYEEFSELPVDRDYKNMALLLPHANPSYLGDDNNISGATGHENKYFIDGVDVTDPNQGNGGTELPYNFIREVRVRTGGYEAEYRSALGGIMEVVTNTGSNEFHGQVFGFFTNSGLSDSPETSVFVIEPGDFTAYDFGFGVGGPIVKDKLWFYGALNPTYRNEDISIPDQGEYQDQYDIYRFAAKLNWRANDNNDFVLSVFGDPGTGDAISDWGIGTVIHAENPDPFLYERTSGSVNSILEGKHWLNDQMMLRSSISYLTNKLSMDPRTERGKNEVLFVDNETHTVSGGTAGKIGKEGTILTAGLHGTWLREQHTWKAGLEYRVITGKTDEYLDMVTRYSDDFYRNDYADAYGEARTMVPSIYLQDSWRISTAFRLNLGLRWDGQIITAEGETAHEILDQWQPRIGFTYQLGAEGNQQIFGSAGRFYQEVSLNLPANAYSSANTYGAIAYDHDPRQDPTGGTLLYEGAGSIPEGLEIQGQHHDEFTLGYERLLAPGSRIRARGIYRTLRRGIEDAYIEEIDDYLIGNVGYGPLDSWERMKRDYQALELTYRISRPKFGARVAYVLSRNQGNFTGLYGSDYHQSFPNLTAAFDDLETMPNSTGLLPNDRTHVFKFSGSYNWDFGLTAGTFLTWMSGTPLNEFGETSWGYYSFLVERGSAGRTPSIWSFNLRLAYRFRPAAQSGLQPRLIVDLMNIGSPGQVVNQDQQYEYYGGSLNSTYGVATAFQPPMSVRLGLELGF